MRDNEYLEWERMQYERRKRTRNQRKRSRAQIALWVAVIVWAAFCITLLTAKAEEIAPDEGLVEEAPVVMPELYDIEAIAFYPVPLDQDLQTHIIRTCDARGIDHAVVMGMIQRESSFNVETIGDGGDSYGLLQIQPKWHAERMAWFGADDLLNPYQNTTIGIDYLVELIEKYEDVEMALVAYNAGSTGAYRDYFSKGIYSSDYSKAVLENAETLKEAVEYVYLSF